MTDAAHLLSDVSGFAVALFAGIYAAKKGGSSHSFGCVLLRFSVVPIGHSACFLCTSPLHLSHSVCPCEREQVLLGIKPDAGRTSAEQINLCIMPVGSMHVQQRLPHAYAWCIHTSTHSSITGITGLRCWALWHQCWPPG